MAKSIILYGVLLGTFIGFCSYVNGVGISSFQQSVISSQPPTSAVILSGTKCSRKISPLEAKSARHAIPSFPAINRQVYSLVPNFQHSLMFRSSPFRYAPVEKTGAKGGFYATSLESNLIRKQIRQIYTAEIGVREKTGKNDGMRVEEYLAVTQLGKGYAWCAAFVSWVFAEAGFPEPRTPWSPALFPKKRVIWERGKAVRKPTSSVILSGKKWSRKISPMAAHIVRPANPTFSSGHQKIYPLRLASAEKTDVGLMPNTRYLTPNTQPLTPASGDVFGIYFANLKRIAHVGFVDEWGDKQVITVEGNTNEAGSGEGDGVYRKRRPISSIYQVANWMREEVDP